jgi:hypothetical protein
MRDDTPRLRLPATMDARGIIEPLLSFPQLRILYTSPTTYESDVKIDRSIDGTGRGRAFYTSAKRNIDATLPALDEQEVAQLLAFFNANMAEPFGFPVGCPPVEMSVVFVGAPTVQPLGAGLYTAAVRVTQFP